MSSSAPPRAELAAIFRAAVSAVDAGRALRRALRRRNGQLELAGQMLAPGARLVVLAVGKAAAGMALALEELAGEWIREGMAVTAEGYGQPLARLRLVEAAHPVPDARCPAAARQALELVARARPEDVLLVLLSGGASSLLCCPDGELRLEDLVRITAGLLASGADIAETNAVRKHLSAVAGGRLALRARCRRIEVLAISDVAGDRLDVIGSGPFAPDPTRYADALRVLRERRIEAPGRVRSHLEAGARGERSETPKPGDPALECVRHTVVASNRVAMAAARREAEARGLRAAVASAAMRGEARVAGRRLAALARASRSPVPLCLVAGGETTVRVLGAGRGGRSQELALAAALELRGDERVTLLAAGTDGRDGPTDAAGAFADGGSVARGAARGLRAERSLADNDAYGFFAAEGGLLLTGPTGTNVMDLVLAHVVPEAGKSG